MSLRGRQAAARALVSAASVVMVLALVAGYARRAGVDSDQFANRATASLRDESVRSLIADEITDQVVLKKQADLIAARPIIQSIASGIVGSAAFTRLFRSAVRDVHRAVFDRDRDTVTLTVSDVGTVLSAALESFRPSLAQRVRSSGKVSLVHRDIGSFSATLARVADRVRLIALLLLVLCVVLVAAALAISPDRRRTVVELGIGTAAAGVLLTVAYGVARSLAIHQADGPRRRRPPARSGTRSWATCGRRRGSSPGRARSSAPRPRR